MIKSKLKSKEHFNSLPALKKLKTGYATLRSPGAISPDLNMISSHSPNSKEGQSPKIPEELIVTGLDDMINKRPAVRKYIEFNDQL